MVAFLIQDRRFILLWMVLGNHWCLDLLYGPPKQCLSSLDSFLNVSVRTYVIDTLPVSPIIIPQVIRCVTNVFDQIFLLDLLHVDSGSFA